MTIADTNVTVTFVPELPEGTPEPEEFSELESVEFFFPGCTVTPSLDKDVREISMIGVTMALDLFRNDNSIMITGFWLDDVEGDYDGLTSLARVHLFFLLNASAYIVGWFRWSSGGTTVYYKVLGHELNCDQEGGKGDMFSYNFKFAIIDMALNDTPPWESS